MKRREIRAFAERDVGAQAALIWERPRLTTDVDATVALAGQNVADTSDSTS